MISSLPGRPREWNSSASASVYLMLLSDMEGALADRLRKSHAQGESGVDWRRTSGYGSFMARAHAPTPMMTQYWPLQEEAGGPTLVLPGRGIFRNTFPDGTTAPTALSRLPR